MCPPPGQRYGEDVAVVTAGEAMREKKKLEKGDPVLSWLGDQLQATLGLTPSLIPQC